MERDRKTTAPKLQVPGVVLLAAVCVYFLAGFNASMHDGASRWLAYGTWHMFTQTIRGGTLVYAETVSRGVATPFDLESLFPYRWETGPRYGKMAGNKGQLEILAKSTCRRLRRAGHPAEVVRLYGIRTEVHPYDEPRLTHERVELLEKPCPRR